MRRRGGTISVTTDVEVYPEDVIDQLDDADLLEAIRERGLQLPPATNQSLAAIIEPFLPDSLERPAYWLAADIADAILGAGRYRKQEATA